MRFLQRILVFLSSITLSTILFWYFGSLWYFLFVLIGVFYLIKGGIKHV